MRKQRAATLVHNLKRASRRSQSHPCLTFNPKTSHTNSHAYSRGLSALGKRRRRLPPSVDGWARSLGPRRPPTGCRWICAGPGRRRYVTGLAGPASSCPCSTPARLVEQACINCHVLMGQCEHTLSHERMARPGAKLPSRESVLAESWRLPPRGGGQARAPVPEVVRTAKRQRPTARQARVRLDPSRIGSVRWRMPKLMITSAGKTGQVDLGPMETTLGRGKHNDVVLNSIFASRSHAVIVVEPAFTIIQDLGSQNGTFVNGERIQTQVLVDGDVLSLGGCELRFISAEQEFSEVEARRLSSVPNWLEDAHGSDEPTAPDDAFKTRGKG
ncbi:hypothetical protein C7T35_29025 [Variovorax sp. WS11]|nr:hypothetical protein C7T35_29025 [Variovorax sp. WS11]